MKKHLLLLACVLFAGISATTHAHVPKKVAYQGYLTNASGQPVSATVNVTFRLYATAVAGSPIWAETQSVVVASGQYTVMLGSDTPLDLDFADPLYLGVSVGADPEMSPRQALSSVPYALRALGVEPGAIGAAELADGSVSPAKLANCGLDQILKFTGSGWACSADANTSVSPADSVTAATAFGLSSAAGTSAAFARGDHSHGTPAAPAQVAPAGSVTAATSFGIASAVGSSVAYARGDHTHGTPAAPAQVLPANSVTSTTTPGLASSAGSSAAYSRGDHSHGTPVAPFTVTFSGAVPSSIAGSSANFVFLGTTAFVTVASTQTRIFGVGTAALGTSSGTATGQITLCYQPAAGGAITSMNGNNYLVVQFGTTRLPYAATAQMNGLVAGNYNVGYCVKNTDPTAINNNDWVYGWFQVVNP